MTQLTSDSIIKDLKDIIEKHGDTDSPPVQYPSTLQATDSIERWIPICSEYKAAAYFWLRDEKGGESLGHSQKPSKVIAWVKVKIDPTKPMGIEILEYCKLP